MPTLKEILAERRRNKEQAQQEVSADTENQVAVAELPLNPFIPTELRDFYACFEGCADF